MLHQISNIMSATGATSANIKVSLDKGEMKLFIQIPTSEVPDAGKLDKKSADLLNALIIGIVISDPVDILSATANDQLLEWSENYIPAAKEFNNLNASKKKLKKSTGKAIPKPAPSPSKPAPSSERVSSVTGSNKDSVSAAEVTEQDVLSQDSSDTGDLLSFLQGNKEA